MPGTTTHNYILFKALTMFGAGSKLTALVQASHAIAYEHAKKNEAEKYLSDDRCVTAGCAYVGCCGPDLFYLETAKKGPGVFIADLMHYNKSGLYLMWCLRQVKKKLAGTEAGHRPDLMHLFAYCLGHISHIAADIRVHPYVNSAVGAYPDNPQVFKNARGSVWLKLWKFHNILEHYQDSYVLHRKFVGMEGFGKDWGTVNIARAAARYYLAKGNSSEWFLVKNAQDFYGFTRKFKSGLEEDKYRFFESSNWFIDLKPYYEETIPDERTMRDSGRMVQGGEYGTDGQLISPGLFDYYIQDAIAQTGVFWGEVDSYMNTPQTEWEDDQLKEEKKCFPQLRRHWNLDTGLAPAADSSASSSWDVPSKPDTSLSIAGRLGYESAHTGAKPDVKLPNG